MRIFIVLEGVLANFDCTHITDLAEPLFWQTMKPNRLMIDETKNLINLGFDVNIISRTVNSSKGAKSIEEAAKFSWIKNVLPEYTKQKNLFYVPLSTSLNRFVSDNNHLQPVKSDDYLISDCAFDNIEWGESNGKFILYIKDLSNEQFMHLKSNSGQSFVCPFDGNILFKIDAVKDFFNKINNSKTYYADFYNSDQVIDFISCIEDIKKEFFEPLKKAASSADADIFDYCKEHDFECVREENRCIITLKPEPITVIDDCEFYCNIENGEVKINDITMTYGFDDFCRISYEDAVSIVDKVQNIIK